MTSDRVYARNVKERCEALGTYEEGREREREREREGSKKWFRFVRGTKSESFNGRRARVVRVAAAGEVMRGTIHRCPFALPLSPTGGGREGACYFGSLDGEDVKRIPGFRRSERVRHYCASCWREEKRGDCGDIMGL